MLDCLNDNLLLNLTQLKEKLAAEEQIHVSTATIHQKNGRTMVYCYDSYLRTYHYEFPKQQNQASEINWQSSSFISMKQTAICFYGIHRKHPRNGPDVM